MAPGADAFTGKAPDRRPGRSVASREVAGLIPESWIALGRTRAGIQTGIRVLAESLLGNDAAPPQRMIDLNQPELSGPGGYPMESPEGLLRALLSDIEDAGTAGSDFFPLEGVAPAGKAAIHRFEEQVKRSVREHVRIFTPGGLEVYRKSGDPDRVSVDTGALPGNVVSHNHPKSTPPSIQDLVVGLAGRALESRICSERYTYAVRFTESTAADLLKEWRHLDSVSYAAGQEWLRSRGGEVAMEELAARRLHAALMELARRGLVKYRRHADVPF